MPRVLAIAEDQWFEMADELAASGSEPTVRGLAALAKRRFGLSASFTTIQALLDSWRRMGGGTRPTGKSASFVALIQRTVEPLYGQLIEEAAAKYGPILNAAETREAEARARAEKFEAQLALTEKERETLASENTSLRAEVSRLQKSEAVLSQRLDEARRESEHRQQALYAAEKRWAEGREDYLTRLQAVEAHNALLLQARHDDNNRYENIITTIQKMREAT
jgi:predicted RNase H-like nuclease (RuvC/YqgF family)